jgi:hypothetical protein
MAIEWLAISAAVIPHVRKFAIERVEKLADRFADAAEKSSIPRS